MQPAALVPAPGASLARGAFSHPVYTVKRPFWTIFGREFRVFSPDGAMVMYVKHPMMKLRDEWRVFADESQQRPLLIMKARELLALNHTTDVTCAETGQRVGALRSRGLKSIVRDTWDVLDLNDQPVGLVQEDSLAVLRRFIPFLMGRWHVELGGAPVAHVREVFRFFTKEFTLDLTHGQERLDPRLGVAAALLALMREIYREEAVTLTE